MRRSAGLGWRAWVVSMKRLLINIAQLIGLWLVLGAVLSAVALAIVPADPPDLGRATQTYHSKDAT